jgi:hypothetical protein
VLRQVAEGVLIHQSEFCLSNAVVVQGRIAGHQAHAPGHAALLIEERGVLVARLAIRLRDRPARPSCQLLGSRLQEAQS